MKNITLLPFLSLLMILLTLNNVLIASAVSVKDLGEGNRPFVQTPLGGIVGTYKKSFSGRKYEAYEGVPYALPPMGNRRFAPPEPVQPWTGNLLATEVVSACVQLTHLPMNKSSVSGIEDCLYLNVYVPITDRSELLPVLFTIHGGAYQWGSAVTGEKFLMDKDIIVASISYRVGIFGFLSTEDDNVLGNMGLKDQSIALRWVSENIQFFGGDPNKVTLLGLSAGAASVHFHYLSPMSRGLFQNGISFSGTVFGPGKLAENSREKVQKLAALLECPTKESREMVECLKHRPANKIAEATRNFMPFLYNPFTPFGPVVEQATDKTFINRSPAGIIASGDIADVLWVTGLVGQEGLYPAAEFINNDKYLKILDENWETLAPHLLDYNFTIPLQKHAEVAKKIKNYYLGKKSISRSTTKQVVSMVGDRLYVVGAEEAARWQARVNKSPVLFYRNDYRASQSVSDFFSNSTNNYGVSHADDFYLLFEHPVIDATKLPQDRAMQVRLIEFVVSVAEKGYPDFGLNFEWKPVDPMKKELDFLHISGPNDINMAMNTRRNMGKKNFWSSIDFDENKL